MCEINTDAYLAFMQDEDQKGYGEFIATDDDIDLKIDLYRESLQERGES